MVVQWDWRTRVFWVGIGLLMLFWSGLFLPVQLGCTIPLVGWSCMIFLLGTPIWVFLLSLFLHTTAWVQILRICLSFAAFGAAVFIIGGLWMLPPPTYGHTRDDPSFELLQDLPLEGSSIRVYRTNGGATTDYGIVVRREWPACGPFYLYEQLYSAYHQMQADVTLDDARKLMMVKGNVLGRDSVTVVEL